MKRIKLFLTIQVLLFSVNSSYTQNVTIPDANFKAALITAGVDTGANNEISYVEAAAVTSLNVSSKSISDLTGIEAFVNLTYLNCSFNQLPSLNLSSNIYLHGLTANNNLLSSIDVSGNSDLISVDCYSNQISSINISGCTSLIDFYCSSNLITDIDLSTNNALKNLDCSSNLIDTLDLVVNTAITTLYINNLPSLTHICVWEIPFPPASLNVYSTGSPNFVYSLLCEPPVNNLNTFSEDSRIIVFPNPASIVIYVNFSGSDIHHLVITDISGKKVYENMYYFNNKAIDISLLNNGMYFLTISNKTQISTGKLIVL